jgi:hypothetical protein
VREQGTIISVDVEVVSDELASSASGGASFLVLESTADFPEDQKRKVRLIDGDNKITVDFTGANDSNNRLTGVSGVTGGPWPVGTRVVLTGSRKVFAQVKIDKEGEPIRARVPKHLEDKITEGPRGLCGETVVIEEDDDGRWHVVRIGDTVDRADAPTVQDPTFDIDKRHGHFAYDSKVTWDKVDQDVDGADIEPEKYIVQMRYTDSSGDPIESTKVHRKTVQAKDKDDDPNDGDDGLHALFRGLRKPKKWYVQFRVRAVDGKRLGKWSEWTDPALPSANLSIAITNVTFDVDQHRLHLEWDCPADADDGDATLKDDDPAISHFQVQIATDSSFNSFRIKRPGSGNYYARIRAVDALGNKGAWYPQPSGYISSNKVKPPKPLAPIVTASSGGSDGVLYRDGAKEKVKVVVRFTYGGGNWVAESDNTTQSGSGTYAIDDDIDKFVVEWEQAKTSTSFTGEPDKRSVVDIKPSQSGETQVVKWKGRKVGRWLKVRYRAVDKKGHKSEFSDWSDAFQVKEPRKLNAPSNIRVKGEKKAAEVRWQAPTSFTNGESADETDITYYLVKLRTGSASGPIVATERVKGTRKRFRYTDADADLDEGTTYYATVEAIGHAGENAVYDDGDPSTHPGSSTSQTPVQSDTVEIDTGDVVTDGGTPAVMGAPTVTPGYKAMLIAWSRPSGTSDPLTYEVYRATSLNGSYSLVASTNDATAFTDENLATNQTYYYKLRAKSRLSNNGSGNSLSSASSNTTLSVPASDIITGNITATLNLTGGDLFVPTSGSGSTRTEIRRDGTIRCYSSNGNGTSTLKLEFDGTNFKIYGGNIETSNPGTARLRMQADDQDLEWISSGNPGNSTASIGRSNGNLRIMEFIGDLSLDAADQISFQSNNGFQFIGGAIDMNAHDINDIGNITWHHAPQWLDGTNDVKANPGIVNGTGETIPGTGTGSAAKPHNWFKVLSANGVIHWIPGFQ